MRATARALSTRLPRIRSTAARSATSDRPASASARRSRRRPWRPAARTAPPPQPRGRRIEDLGRSAVRRDPELVDRAEVLDEAAHPLGLLGDRLAGASCARRVRGRPVAERLGEPGHDRQRRLQIVADVRQQVAFLGPDPVQLGGHRVEPMRQLADLARALGRERRGRRGTGRRHDRGRLGQAAERSRDRARQEPGDRDRDERRDEGHGRQDPQEVAQGQGAGSVRRGQDDRQRPDEHALAAHDRRRVEHPRAILRRQAPADRLPGDEVSPELDRPDIDPDLARVGGHDAVADERVQPDLRPELGLDRGQGRAELGDRPDRRIRARTGWATSPRALIVASWCERPEPDEEPGPDRQRRDEPDGDEGDGDPRGDAVRHRRSGDSRRRARIRSSGRPGRASCAARRRGHRPSGSHRRNRCPRRPRGAIRG